MTLNPYSYSLFEAIATALKPDGVCGKKHDMDEPGETYAFVFQYQTEHNRTLRVYTKLNLTPDGRVVVIYSAHPPRKEDELTQ